MIKEQKAMSIIRDRDIREPLFDYLEELFQRDYTMIEETFSYLPKEMLNVIDLFYEKFSTDNK